MARKKSSIEVLELEFSSLDNLNYVDISFIHSGISQIRKEGESYLFQQYLNSDTRPIQWITRYNDNGSKQGLQTDSLSSRSLIAAVIGNNAENLEIFASPGAWADLFVRRTASPDFSTDNVQINCLRIKVNYEYTPSLNNIKTLSVAAELISKAPPAYSAPPIEVLTADLKNRTDGQGNFLRSYASQERVSLKAPVNYEQLKFLAWLENGVVVSENPQVEIIMDRDKTVLPRYIGQGFGSLREFPVVNLDGQASSTRFYAAALDSLGSTRSHWELMRNLILKLNYMSLLNIGAVSEIFMSLQYTKAFAT